MVYVPLSKVYHKCPAEHESVYAKRFNAPSTTHFGFSIRQYGRRNEYPAFLCYTEEFVLLVETIYQKHEQLLRSLSEVSTLLMRQFELFSVVEEVRATSDIEGVHSTRREIEDVVNGASRSPRFSSIVGKYLALDGHTDFRFETCEDIRAFYDEFVHREIAAEEPSHKLDGELFRKDAAQIFSATGKIIHQGVQPETKIIELLEVALKILNAEEIPLLVRVSVFHYLFEYVHPFYDGNGRTARFIVSYFLSRRFHKLIALRLSLSIKRRKKLYYDLFAETDSEWNCGDLTPFVIGFTKIIAATFDDLVPPLEAKIKQLIKFKERSKALVCGDALTFRLYEILLESSVFFAQGVCMDELIGLTRKSRNTIKMRLDSMPKEHLLKGGGKKIFYKLNMGMFRT